MNTLAQLGLRELSENTTMQMKSMNGQDFFSIHEIQRFRPFLINVVSESDLWMFLSSRGGLTAGRGSAAQSLFPYETVDRLHDGHHTTGPLCMLRIECNGRGVLWNPFESRHDASGQSLHKNAVGNQVVFSSTCEEFPLVVKQRWTSAQDLGHIRTVTVSNHGATDITFDLLDGLRNILPWGVELSTQQMASCLVAAYKRSEVDDATGLGIFCLTARITDRADPAESLRANVVYQCGLEDAIVSMQASCPLDFSKGNDIRPNRLVTGDCGNYFITKKGIVLAAGQSMTWHLLMDVGLDHVQIVRLQHELTEGTLSPSSIERAIQNGTDGLRQLIGRADGLQTSGNPNATVHHFANTTFNSMRGGVFIDHHFVPVATFRDHVARANRDVHARHLDFLRGLSDPMDVRALHEKCAAQGDADLDRICREFLPLTFSRRHGDPSRPWNSFEIKLYDKNGNREIYYAGNWRDIFQNWESTCQSYPHFIPGVVTRFVNGSTADGFNPYRVTSEHLEWEVPNPEDPWSHIGYWGDHQIVYLLKLLESFDKLDPTTLSNMLVQDSFAYLRIPYRLRNYDALTDDRRHTIDFDWDLHKHLEQQVDEIGQDGKLIQDGDGHVYHVNLFEKLLVPALSKVANLVVSGGIWMNTQRPEWNDANNALVGNGISVVTLAYLHRYCKFARNLSERSGHSQVTLSREVASWMQQTLDVLHKHRNESAREIKPARRRAILDELGRAFESYRSTVYPSGFSGRQEVSCEIIQRFFEMVATYCRDTLKANQRENGLFHAYNLLHFDDDQFLHVQHLHEMLEGQVAAIESGVISPQEVIGLVERLYESPMYRPDQHTFMLYPETTIPNFLDRNVAPEAKVLANPLLAAMLKVNDARIVQRDASGVLRFHGDLSNEKDVAKVMDQLESEPAWTELARTHGTEVVKLFYETFQHASYTGRSGTMYRYEGIGCIYWHMISKLLLAVQKIFHHAINTDEDDATVRRLAALYYQLRRGLCFEKSAHEYGAFPTDPYSHTPGHAGAEQPGMTGQVKEGILSRWGELGIDIEQGVVQFDPRLLELKEFLDEPTEMDFVGFDGQLSQRTLAANEMGFTYCQVPIIYQLADKRSIQVNWADGRCEPLAGSRLSEQASHSLLGRTGELREIRVAVDASRLMR